MLRTRTQPAYMEDACTCPLPGAVVLALSQELELPDLIMHLAAWGYVRSACGGMLYSVVEV